jgi:hypothetical protein
MQLLDETDVIKQTIAVEFQMFLSALATLGYYYSCHLGADAIRPLSVCPGDC